MKTLIKRLAVDKWFHLLVNTAMFVLLAWLLPIHFETNDDVAMCMIANGKYTGTPDGHLVFINALVGWTMAGLYSLTSAVEWYSLVLCLAQVLAMTGLTYAVATDGNTKRLMKTVMLLFLYVFWARIIIAFQFTTTSGLLCVSGCVLMLKPQQRSRLIGLCYIVVASLIRFDASAMVGFLFAPMFLAVWARNRKFGYWIGSLVFLVFLGVAGDRFFYRTPEWTAYKEYNALRGYINDNPNNDLTASELPEGVSMEDYQMLKWFSPDPMVLTTEKLQAIKSSIKQHVTLKSAVSNLSQLSGYGTTLVWLLLAYGILCAAMTKSTKSSEVYQSNGRWVRLAFIAQPFFVFFVFAVFVFYIGMTEVFKSRAFLCMLLAMVCQLVMLFPSDGSRITRALGSVLLLMFVVLTAKYIKQVDKVNSLYRAHQQEFYANEFPLVKNRTDVIHGCRLEEVSPFKVKDIEFTNIGMGWMTKIPFNLGRLEKHLDFVDSNILYLSKVDSPPTDIANSIERNYGIEVEMEEVDRNEIYALYKFVSK